MKNYNLQEMSEEISNLETYQGSFLKYFSPQPGKSLTVWKSFLKPYFISVILLFVVQYVLAFIILPKNHIILYNINIIVPYKINLRLLNDYGSFLAFLCTMPILFVLLLTERSMFPSYFSGILKASESVNDEKEFEKLSNRLTSERYRNWNIGAQILSLLVAIFNIWYMRHTFLKGNYFGWQVKIDSANILKRTINVPGWFNILVVSLFAYFVFFYLLRGIAHSIILYNFTRAINFLVKPFHWDKSGGLNAVGQIGLRNQYLVLLAGLNILAYVYQPKAMTTQSNAPRTLLLIWIAVYIIGFLTMVVIPMYPFHKLLVEEKNKYRKIVSNQIQIRYSTIIKDLPIKNISENDDEILSRLKNLNVLVESITEWPFETSKIKKILSLNAIIPMLAILFEVLKKI